MRLRRILCCKKANDGFSFLSLGLVQVQNGTSKPVSLPCIFVPIYSILLSFYNVFYEYMYGDSDSYQAMYGDSVSNQAMYGDSVSNQAMYGDNVSDHIWRNFLEYVHIWGECLIDLSTFECGASYQVTCGDSVPYQTI
jgi:hypothetical protein